MDNLIIIEKDNIFNKYFENIKTELKRDGTINNENLNNFIETAYQSLSQFDITFEDDILKVNYPKFKNEPIVYKLIEYYYRYLKYSEIINNTNTTDLVNLINEINSSLKDFNLIIVVPITHLRNVGYKYCCNSFSVSFRFEMDRILRFLNRHTNFKHMEIWLE